MRVAAVVLMLAACGPAWAQRERAPRPAPPAATAASPAASPSEPQRTTATFDDWTLRCLRPEQGSAACEVSQIVYNQTQPVAQTALGRPAKSDQMRLTLLVPVNVQLATAPKLVDAGEPIDLAWVHCLPSGCIADTAVSEEQVRRLRGQTERGRFVFKDGAGRDISVPFTPRGLGAALDALAKEAG